MPSYLNVSYYIKSCLRLYKVQTVSQDFIPSPESTALLYLTLVYYYYITFLDNLTVYLLFKPNYYEQY